MTPCCCHLPDEREDMTACLKADRQRPAEPTPAARRTDIASLFGQPTTLHRARAHPGLLANPAGFSSRKRRKANAQAGFPSAPRPGFPLGALCPLSEGPLRGSGHRGARPGRAPASFSRGSLCLPLTPALPRPCLIFTPFPFARSLEAPPQRPTRPQPPLNARLVLTRPSTPRLPQRHLSASAPASPQGAASLRAAACAPRTPSHPARGSRLFSRERRGRCHGGGGAGGGRRRGPGGGAGRGGAGVSEGRVADRRHCRSGERVSSPPRAGFVGPRRPGFA